MTMAPESDNEKFECLTRAALSSTTKNPEQAAEFMLAMIDEFRLLIVNLANSGDLKLDIFDREMRAMARFDHECGREYRAQLHEIEINAIQEMVRAKADAWRTLPETRA